MTHLFQWLPITVIAAIIIFVIKEILELRRRRGADARKILGVRSLLARECEFNHWALKAIRSAHEGAERALSSEPEGRFSIVRRASGRERWQREDHHGEFEEGGSLPTVRMSTLESVVPTLAELDKSLFSKVEIALESCADLNHLRSSLTDYSEGSDVIDEIFFKGYVDWALEEFDDIFSGLDSLYSSCTDSKLERFRLR